MHAHGSRKAFAIFIKSLCVVKHFLPVYFRKILFAGLLLASISCKAQQLQQAPWNDPAVHWLTPPQAQVKVQNELDLLQPQLSDLTPGTPAHTDLLRRILLYKSILRALLDELPVPQTIDLALPEAASLGGIYEQAFTPESTLRALYDEAQALLTN